MQTFEFKQTNRTKLLIIGIGYFLLLMAFTVYATLGTTVIVDFINSFNSGAFVGLLGGIVFIAPLILLLKLSTNKATLTLYDDRLLIATKNNELVIHYDGINGMELNKRAPNELELIDHKEKIIFTLRPRNNGELIESLIKHLKQKIDFGQTVIQKKAIGGYYNAISYRRKEK